MFLNEKIKQQKSSMNEKPECSFNIDEFEILTFRCQTDDNIQIKRINRRKR